MLVNLINTSAIEANSNNTEPENCDYCQKFVNDFDNVYELFEKNTMKIIKAIRE
jgi:hypothetical protein